VQDGRASPPLWGGQPQSGPSGLAQEFLQVGGVVAGWPSAQCARQDDVPVRETVGSPHQRAGDADAAARGVNSTAHKGSQKHRWAACGCAA
jgi:hypothetical protein